MTPSAFGDLRRLVIKIGTSLLIDADNKLDRSWLDDLAADIAVLRDITATRS